MPGTRSTPDMRNTATANAPAVEEAKKYSAERDVDLRTVELDVTDEPSVRTAAKQVLSGAGQIDVLVHNAGHIVTGPAEAFTPEQLAALYDTNVINRVGCAGCRGQNDTSPQHLLVGVVRERASAVSRPRASSSMTTVDAVVRLPRDGGSRPAKSRAPRQRLGLRDADTPPGWAQAALPNGRVGRPRDTDAAVRSTGRLGGLRWRGWGRRAARVCSRRHGSSGRGVPWQRRRAGRERGVAAV